MSRYADEAVCVRHRPGVWATADGRCFADEGDHYRDTLVDVINGVEVIWQRVDANRWRRMRQTLPAEILAEIRTALVGVHGEGAITRTEAA